MDKKHNHVPRWFEYISQLGASLLVDATGKLFRDYDYVQTALHAHPKPPNDHPITRPRPTDDLSYDSEDEELKPSQERKARYKEDKNAQSAGTKGQPLLTLEYLVSSMSIFNVTNAHDSVYALLGIAKDTTPTAVGNDLRVTDHTQAALEMFTAKKHYPVDYKAHYIDVCKEFMQFCIRQSLKRDPSRALDVICRPWAVEMPEANDERQLPSWLPRLSNASFGMVLGPGIDGLRMGRKNADSLVGLPNVTHRNYNAAETRGLDTKTFAFRKRSLMPVPTPDAPKPSTLVATEQLVNVATSTPEDPTTTDGYDGNNAASPPNERGSDESNTPAPESEPCALAHAAEVASKYVLQESPCYFSLYVKGFILDEVASLQAASQTGSIPTAWAKFAEWDMEGTPPDHFWRTLVADRGSNGQNPPVYYSRACQESFRKGGASQGTVDTMGLIDNERNSVVAQFCRRVQAAIWNRAFIRTENKHFGLAPHNVKEKDLICILYGCSVPVVLRRFSKSADQVKHEMEEELRYIAGYVVSSCRSHLARRKLFRDKRKSDMVKYKQWEERKRKEWKEDKPWNDLWRLVQPGLLQIHEFRAWANDNRQSDELEETKRPNGAYRARKVMQNCCQIWLSHIYELAQWAAKSSNTKGTIIEQLRSAEDDSNAPRSLYMTLEQRALWDKFIADRSWRRDWESKSSKYKDKEGFQAWAHRKGYNGIGYKDERTEARKKWKQEQKVNNQFGEELDSWYLCIDPFRAWLRERGKFCGPSEELDLKQEWEKDSDWHKSQDGSRSEQESFMAWRDSRGPTNRETGFAEGNINDDDYSAEMDAWMPG